MQFEKNNKYFTLCIYIFMTSAAIIIAALGIFHFQEVLDFIFRILDKCYDLLKPLIIGGIIAYLLDPIVEFYEKRCLNTKRKSFLIQWFSLGKKRKSEEEKPKGNLRTKPTLLTVLTLIAIIGLFVMIVVMNLKNVLGTEAFQSIYLSISKYITYFENMLYQFDDFTGKMNLFTNQTRLITIVYGYVNDFFARLSRQTFHFFTAIGSNIMNIALAFVIAFYLLQDKKRVLLLIRKVLRSLLPEKIYLNLRVLGKDIDYVFSNYIRGQMIDAVIVAVLTSLALTIIRMDFAIVIGVIAGLFNLIPYFGPAVGFILAGLIGLIGPDPMKAVYGVVLLFIIQQIDGWVIVPKVVGNSVKLHPIIVLLAILTGGNLFGLPGMLLGVPVAAFIRLVIIRYAGDLFEDKRA